MVFRYGLITYQIIGSHIHQLKVFKGLLCLREQAVGEHPCSISLHDMPSPTTALQMQDSGEVSTLLRSYQPFWNVRLLLWKSLYITLLQPRCEY